MRKLDQKLFRDLITLKGQATAIVMVIAAGVGTFVMSMCAYASLQWSKDYFYGEFRFADVFSETGRTPDALIPRMKEISGVSAVETRLVYDVLLDVPEMSEPASARLISVPETGDCRLNKVYISRGRMLEPERTGEVVVSEVFAEAHGFVAGDHVKAILNGKSQTLTIVGIALSPEYVIQVQPGSIMPDNKRFGILWISQRDLEAAFDMTGAFNSVSLKLAYSSNEDEVISQLDRLLRPYGSVGAYGRDQQISHQYLSDELTQLRGMAVMAPTIFLSVAAFLLNIVISRIISQQREQIAALKAFGYTHREVGFHYLNLVLVISLSGTILGTLFGFWMASGMTKMYAEFYKFPMLEFQFDVPAILLAFLLTTVTAVLGTWVSVHHAIRLPPAEAMRPEPPPSFKPTLLERLVPRHLMPPEMRMVIRNVARKPFKAGFSMLGISMAVAVMILGNFSLDAMDYMMTFQFRLAQRQDLMVTFVEPATASVMYEMSELDGVLDSETLRTVATRIHFQNRSRRLAIMGLQRDPQLYRLLDKNEHSVAVPEFGIMLNTKLARLLGVRLGDRVLVEVLEDKRPTVTVEVTALVEEYAGLNAYMNKDQLHRLLKESSVASGAFLKVDENQIDQVFRELEMRPGVAGVTIKDAVLHSFEKTVAENILVMRSFFVFFASVIAIGVVYNSSRISLSERSRDLATMRVVGYTRREVSMVLLGEIALLTLAAIPLGAVIGYALAGVMVAGLDTDNYRIPLVVSRNTFALAAFVVILATALSCLVVQRRIHRLDLVGVLKTRE
ncbi:ABC transporter permease [Novipirellula artificiosorum]|uniref:Macrolide transporter ATP-binding /permease protein n=1 Tax=Novipirellula artificiosorum TaxID=2528016 RepID=A0A5C6DMK7_9BACT|nr:ABC transporter permease [Novipirellula artificiosorum]TWU37087.1 macrolide transporter ATP-binding /permease protein [Novipirellula artificiosorum]